MRHYKDLDGIPWNSLGRETVTHRVGRSIVPVGVYPFDLAPFSSVEAIPAISGNHPEMEKYLMNIVGTAIQAGPGKLVTCLHVADALITMRRKGYILARLIRDDLIRYTPYPIETALRYVDPRTDKVNPDVDLSVLICTAKSLPDLPYEVPPVDWGDSAQLGVGDSVIVGGYPHGLEMFKFAQSNRGLIQPTFYQGIVSAILPAMKLGETRLLQISVACAGGTSGGAVFCPKTGQVLGMVTSCVHALSIPQPISYAIPSEIIAPYVNAITFETKAGD